MALLEGKVAIVTGAGRGIGKALALQMAEEGARVVVNDAGVGPDGVGHDNGPAEQVVAEIKDKGLTAVANYDSVATMDGGDSIIKTALDSFGRLDILVNNAGMTRDGLVLRMSDADFDEVLAVNLRSVFITCRAAARPMMRGRFGRIVNIGSVTGLIGNTGQVNYAAAKAGLVGLTKSLAKELGAKGITANVVAPGFIETDITAGLSPQQREQAAKAVPSRRFGRSEEIAHAVSYVASDLAGYMTGQVLVVDGGLAC